MTEFRAFSQRNPRRPPLRVCPGCGGHHYAWSEIECCADCKRHGVEGHAGVGIAALVRKQREDRRILDRLPEPPPVADDGIPY